MNLNFPPQEEPATEELDWLQEHMEKYLAAADPTVARPMKEASPSAATRSGQSLELVKTRDGQSAVDLVNQAVELVRGIEKRAKEKETYADGIAEKLRIAESRIEELVKELEAERRAAEIHVNKSNVTIRDLADALKEERSRVTTAEDELRQLEVRASTAEARAKESEDAIARIEDAIRTQLLGQGRSVSKGPAAAA